MFAKVNYILNLIVRGISETANIFISGIIFIFIFLDIDSFILINNIALLSLINFLCAYALDFFVFKGNSLNNRKKYTYFFIAIVLSLVSAFITSKETRFVPFIMYLIIWYKSILSITDKRDFQSTKNIFIISLLLYLFVVFILNITNGYSATTTRLKSFFPIYVGATLSHFALLNLESVYNNKKVNSINKNQNMRIVNLISYLMVSIFLVFTLTGFFGLWERIFFSNIFKGFGVVIQKAVEVVLYPIVLLITKLVELIFKKSDLSRLKQLNVGKTPEEIEKIANETLSSKNQVIIDRAFSIVKLLVVGLIIYVILFYLIKAIKNKVLYSNLEDEEEEKEFILSYKDIPIKMKKSFRKIFAKISELFLENSSVLNLHIIRRIYIDTILTLRGEGHEFKNHHTPNEYLSLLENTKYINTGIYDLTKVYNDYRYGRKEPTEEDIEECLRAKKNIYEISKGK
ncbi:hypothetical protein DW1_2077 [Proteiniborus sp. DW1]|uniref:DUF4129 domain-containing protein n=1 Tax=Proteiniborus sp. DW1 TaxID=1889883 RepID=UPI00092DF009|nr:DUF4129 domain-containing protein [Proteiniborus sp. DW1]SCG83644.1 hypothetical protein DW1_2077 [Proteiniborus sp. DW1]